MGAFDIVKFDPAKVCLKCDNTLLEFQTKDSPDQCLLTRTIQHKELLAEVMYPEMRHPITQTLIKEAQRYLGDDEPAMTWNVYTLCKNCKYWNEHKLVIVNHVIIKELVVNSPMNDDWSAA